MDLARPQFCHAKTLTNRRRSSMEPNAPRRRRGGNGPRPGQKPTTLQRRRMGVLDDTSTPQADSLPSKAYALQNGIWTLASQLEMVSEPADIQKFGKNRASPSLVNLQRRRSKTEVKREGAARNLRSRNSKTNRAWLTAVARGARYVFILGIVHAML